MIEITDEIREEVIEYLNCEYGDYPNELYSFYYTCMISLMNYRTV